MTLALDPRQRAMLDEIGVKVWWPDNAPAKTEADAVAVAVRPATRSADSESTATRVRMASPSPVSPVSFAPPLPPASPGPRAAPSPATDIAPAKAAPAAGPVASSGPAVLIEAPQRLYDGTGNAQGGWLIVADMAPDPDGRHGAPFTGDAGRLLDNMLRALHLHSGERPVHLMRTHRGSAAGGSATGGSSPFADSFAVQAGGLAPRVVLAMGPLAAQALFDSTEPLGKLRGRVAAPAAWPDAWLIATYPPGYLLRNPADKARAWADLCLAATKMDELEA